jgi:CDP-diacylglycerol---serine O-phosphatidyltransferase
MSISKHVPNALTCGNLIMGCVAIEFAVECNFDLALICMLISAVFDFFDGMAARALNAHSPIGKDLDSLADMVSFGVSPALIFSYAMDSGITGNSFLIFLPLLIAAFSALRLAKFNTDPRQATTFIGLATPANALLVASLFCTSKFYPAIWHFWHVVPWLLGVIAVGLSLLLVSEIPMFSFKFKNFTWADNKLRFVFLGIVLLEALATLVLGLRWSVIVFLAFATYIILNLLLLLKRTA